MDTNNGFEDGIDDGVEDNVDDGIDDCDDDGFDRDPARKEILSARKPKTKLKLQKDDDWVGAQSTGKIKQSSSCLLRSVVDGGKNTMRWLCAFNA